MDLKEIRAKARNMGIIGIKGMDKDHLIRAIQRQEENFVCYGTASGGYCTQEDCLWYPDCMEDSKK